MKITLLVFLFLMKIIYADAQITFQKTFDYSKSLFGHCVKQTRDGGYIIATDNRLTDNKTYLTKTDSIGNAEWSKSYGDINNRLNIISIDQTFDGGYIFSGSQRDTNSHGYVMKIDSNGTQVFNRIFGFNGYSEMNYACKQTIEGDYIVAGPFKVNGWVLYDDAQLMKFDSNGSLIWSKTFAGSAADELNSFQQTSDSGFILLGDTRSFGLGEEDIFAIKTDKDGNISWSKTYGTTSREIGHSIQQTIDGGYIIAGHGLINDSCYVLRLDTAGTIIWSKKYGRLNGNLMTIKLSFDGGYILCGGSNQNISLIKLSSNGFVSWTKSYGFTGGSNDEDGYDVEQTSDGGYIIVGMTDSSNTTHNMTYLIKTDISGNSGCVQNSATTAVSNFSMVTNSFSPTITTGINNYSTSISDSIELPIANTICLDLNNFIYETRQSPPLIYPNPFSSWTKISLPVQSIFKNVTVKLFNLQGQQVRMIDNINGQEFVLQRGNLPDGIYFISLTQENETNIIGKLIVTGDK